MSKIDLSSMSAVELRTYAKEELGVALPATLKKSELVARIREVGVDDDVSPVGEARATEGNENKRPVRVVINISENDDHDRNYIRVNENGKSYQLMKGRDITVPYGVYDNLKCAVEAVPVKFTEDGHEKIKMVERPRFAFSVIEMIYAEK